MRKMQVNLSVGLFDLKTPAFAQDVWGHYYKHYRYARIPETATAVAPEATPVPQRSCHLVHATFHPYCPPDCQWTTACGPS
jgi:hypothetical protein